MYEQSLPPSEDSPEVAAGWAREVARALLPEVAEDASRIARHLVGQAVPRTPASEMIHVTISVSDTGLRVAVRDPNAPSARTGLDIASASLITTALGTEEYAGTHMAWAELRPRTAATA